MCWTQRSRTTCLCLVRGRLCIVMATALAITMATHIVMLALIIDRQSALWNLKITANLDPHRLVHSGRYATNGTVTPNHIQINAAGNHGNEKHLAFKHSHHLVRRADDMVNIHDRVNIHELKRPRRIIGHVKRRRHLKGDINVSQRQPPGRTGEAAGGAPWSVETDMTLEGLMPIKSEVPSTGGDRIT